MKTQFAWMFATAAMLVGCTTAEEQYAGSDAAPDLGTEFSELPMAVQRTIKEQVPQGRIDDIDREERSGQTIYEVTFAEPGLNPKMHITADGRVVQVGDMIVETAGAVPGGITLRWNDLPMQVQRTIVDNAPGSLVKDIHAQNWNGRTVYQVTFDNVSYHDPILHVAEDGTLVGEVP